MVKKVAILAGGRGARLLEETRCHPKPMCLIGEEPILTHIMRHYSNYGFTEFVVAIGYLGESIVEYFSSRGKAVPGPSGCVRIIKFEDTDWVIDLVDTDLDTNTGGRLKRLAPFLGD